MRLLPFIDGNVEEFIAVIIVLYFTGSAGYRDYIDGFVCVRH
jgi:hypothetical protein